MRYNLLFYIIIASITLSLFGCRSVKLNDADAAFERGEYFEAQKIYRKVYNNLKRKEERPLKGEVAYKLGLCYDKLNMSGRAAAAFQNALRYHYPDSLIFRYLGKAFQSEGKYALAIDAYDTFLEYKPEDMVAKEAIKGCKLALGSNENNQTRYLVKISKTFNSRRSDYAPQFLDKTLNQIYFTSTNEKASGNTHSGITGMKNGDIYFSKKNERGEWLPPQPAEGDLNTDADEGIVSFSPDGQTMYLTKASYSETANSTVEIFTSKRSDATWTTPQKFEIINDSIAAIGQPAVSADGRFLYFVSDMPGGYGGLDIWRITIDDKTGTLVNLGPQINTPGNEMFPYSRNDSIFYFSSDGHPGFGGLDIFKASLNSSGNYWSVENMGRPINSPGDDFGITFGEGESGFFSSNRGDARGYDHIYAFELPEIHITISGCVFDKDDEPVSGAIIRIIGDDGSNQRAMARDDGSFTFNLGRGIRYVMKAGAPGYLNVKQEFTSDETEEDADYEINFNLVAINKPQVVENIFYDFDRYSLRPESKEALDEVVSMLNDNPHVAIEMGAHTDRKGTEDYNLSLSEKRAKSVIDYLINAGIDSARLTYKGYGKNMPKTVTRKINHDYPQFEEGIVLTEDFIETLNLEDQEAADQINRRTEFKIISTEFNLM